MLMKDMQAKVRRKFQNAGGLPGKLKGRNANQYWKMAPVLLYFESFSKDLAFAESPLYSPESNILQTQGARCAKNYLIDSGITPYKLDS